MGNSLDSEEQDRPPFISMSRPAGLFKTSVLEIYDSVRIVHLSDGPPEEPTDRCAR